MISYNYKYNVTAHSFITQLVARIHNNTNRVFPIFQELYTWDSGNMLTYPIKCRALGNDTNVNSNAISDIRPTPANVTREVKNKKTLT